MAKLKGSINIPGDKSISHRALIFSALSTGQTKIENLLESEDTFSTIKILRKLGIKIKKTKKYWVVFGNGVGGFIEPNSSLDCGNSGTTARLMLGAVSSNPINCTFIGDDSLSKRSMSRVTNYLEKNGADFKLTKNDYLPVLIEGSDNLLPFKHVIQSPSAQVKSALILSALNIKGKTRIVEKKQTRDHTENLMNYLNINFKINKLNGGKKEIVMNGPYEIKSRNIKVASDPSSAAFFIVGALIVPKSKIILRKILLNPTRIAFIKILKKMGGQIHIQKSKDVCGEIVGDIKIKHSKLKGINIPSSLSPLLIDEYPILAIAATQAIGKTTMNGLEELRYKESDRIKSIVTNLNKIGFNIINKKNAIIIKYTSLKLSNIKKVNSFNDHRIAMSFKILNLLYNNKIQINNEKCISISYPEFNKHLSSLYN